MPRLREKYYAREAKRLETRERVFNAAVNEFKQTGTADTEIADIVAEAGVVRGTFYFHFPTKEHVLAELTRREEALIGHELEAVLQDVHDLRSALGRIVARIVAEEARLGSPLFRDVLGLYFSTTQPELTDASTHPVVTVVIQQIELARDRGEVFDEVDAAHSSVFFLLGLYALLLVNRDPQPARAGVLDKYLAGFCRGLEAR